MKILVVDDDKEIAQLLEIYIKNEGYEPITAYNGKEALTKLHKKMEIFIKVVVVVVDDDERLEVQKSHRHPFGILVGQQ